MGRYVYVREKKTKAYQPGHWSAKKKTEAVCLWITGMSLTQISAELNVPYHTIKDWRTTTWWADIAKDLRSEDTQKLDAKLTKILDKSLDTLMDRLENGEYIYDQKTGKVRRAPAKMRDATVAFNAVMDKRQLIRKEPTRITEQASTSEQLKNLAQQFAEFVTGKKQEEPQEKLVNEYIDEETIVRDENGSFVIKD